MQLQDRPAASQEQPLHTFMGIELELSDGVLVPRQETELLGEKAVAILRGRPDGCVVVDMCCGSGNLALAIASQIDSAHIWAADLTETSVELTKRNADRLGLAERVNIRCGDLFAAFEADGLERKIDLVVCNPPYISTTRLDGESAHLLQHEPREAFDGGPYGISIHQRLIREAVDFLKPGGWLVFEFGEGQERQAAALITRTRAYDSVEFSYDDAGKARVASAQRVTGQNSPGFKANRLR